MTSLAPPQEEAIANAHLIAAAPEMLRALKGLVIAYGVDKESVVDPDYWDRALTAISKAEGKESL